MDPEENKHSRNAYIVNVKQIPSLALRSPPLYNLNPEALASGSKSPVVIQRHKRRQFSSLVLLRVQAEITGS